jgi:alpha-D-ribose 1-methylphosphonate 5-triphosphate synthase subunit PhnH
MTVAVARAPDDSALQAQATFRAVMSATARPGTVRDVPATAGAPQPMSSAFASLALTLLDHETPVWLDAQFDEAGVVDWLRFQTGAPFVREPSQAAFALIADPLSLPPLESFGLGTPEYPDRSTTLLMQVRSFRRGPAMTLAGPGIKDPLPFRAEPMPADIVSRLAANRGLFPRGVDLLLASGGAVAALPRSVRVTFGER